MMTIQPMNGTDRNAQPCIWMQAGVVPRRICTNAYECTACRFDRALRRTARENRVLRDEGRIPGGKRGAIVSWKDKLKTLPPLQRPCLHHMKGRITFRACSHDYLCGNCDFDQYFNDQFTVCAVVRPVEVLDVKGVRLPQGYYLHPGHCWVKIEEDAAVRIGLDDFALRVLGPLDRIEAPLIGKEFTQDSAAIALRRGAYSARALAPVGGVVTDVNPRLRERGSLANSDPYTDGWVLRVHAANLRRDLGRLMIGEQASGFLDQEIDRLYRMIEESAGPLTTDGGHIGSNIFGHLPQLGWETLTTVFLRT